VNDDARSPLAKRKKLSEARRGASRLKVGVVASEVERESDEDADAEDGVGSGTQSRDDSSADGDESGAFDLDEDFLVGELEEEGEEEDGG